MSALPMKSPVVPKEILPGIWAWQWCIKAGEIYDLWAPKDWHVRPGAYWSPALILFYMDYGVIGDPLMSAKEAAWQSSPRYLAMLAVSGYKREEILFGQGRDDDPEDTDVARCVGMRQQHREAIEDAQRQATKGFGLR